MAALKKINAIRVRTAMTASGWEAASMGRWFR
jgi:hypothetical protein